MCRFSRQAAHLSKDGEKRVPGNLCPTMAGMGTGGAQHDTFCVPTARSFNLGYWANHPGLTPNRLGTHRQMTVAEEGWAERLRAPLLNRA